jgi:DNA-binding NtrC family response regulator
MPPLRERKEDIPLLAEGLLERIAVRVHKSKPKLTDTALQQLMAYDWPGNVRELENMLTQASVHARTGIITPDLLPSGQVSSNAEETGATTVPEEGLTLRTLDEVEAEHVQRALDYTGGHKGRTSEILGISRPALDRKIEKYGLKLPGRRDA